MSHNLATTVGALLAPPVEQIPPLPVLYGSARRFLPLLESSSTDRYGRRTSSSRRSSPSDGRSSGQLSRATSSSTFQTPCSPSPSQKMANPADVLHHLRRRPAQVTSSGRPSLPLSESSSAGCYGRRTNPSRGSSSSGGCSFSPAPGGGWNLHSSPSSNRRSQPGSRRALLRRPDVRATVGAQPFRQLLHRRRRAGRSSSAQGSCQPVRREQGGVPCSQIQQKKENTLQTQISRGGFQPRDRHLVQDHLDTSLGYITGRRRQPSSGLMDDKYASIPPPPPPPREDVFLAGWS